jgi:hypothetical protein
MARDIAVPAETLRQTAKNSSAEEQRAFSDDRTATGRSILRARDAALNAAKGFDGEFVSIDSSYATTLCCFGHTEYSDGLKAILKEENIW